jgi:hypothetical protein
MISLVSVRRFPPSIIVSAPGLFAGVPASGSGSNFPRRGPPWSGGCSKDFLSLTELPPASVETPLNKLLAFLRA